MLLTTIWLVHRSEIEKCSSYALDNRVLAFFTWLDYGWFKAFDAQFLIFHSVFRVLRLHGRSPSFPLNGNGAFLVLLLQFQIAHIRFVKKPKPKLTS